MLPAPEQDELGRQEQASEPAAASVDGQEEDMEEYEYEMVVDNRPMFICPGLWLGSVDAENNLAALLGTRITHVLTVGPRGPL
jgi:hypothetical protein